jgi:hypothetical protein
MQRSSDNNAADLNHLNAANAEKHAGTLGEVTHERQRETWSDSSVNASFARIRAYKPP